MKPGAPDIYQERPLQKRSVDCQLGELSIDPMGYSPLEKALGAAILALLLDPLEFGPPNFINLFLSRLEVQSREDFPPVLPRPEGVINVAPGCWLDMYQPDFLFCVKAPDSDYVAWGALECDGHNFHEMTPEQVAHDRKRDRVFQAGGVAILRFPGWQVHDDPAECARETIKILLRISHSKGQPQK